MALSKKERAAYRLHEKGLTDRMIGIELGCSREWACKLRIRAEKKRLALTAFAHTHAADPKTSNIETLCDTFGSINKAHPRPEGEPRRRLAA